MKNRTVLCFDFDGVLINNTLLGFKKVDQILAELNLPSVPVDFIRQNWGLSVDDLARVTLGRFKKANGEYIGYFRQRAKEINIKPVLDNDLLGALISLPEFGFINAIITNRDKYDLEKYSEEIGFNLKMFDFIQTKDDHPISKPDGQVFGPLILWLHDIGHFNSSNVAYFGDTLRMDYQAVLNANIQGQQIKFVGVCSGVNTYEEFATAGLNETEIVASHDVLHYYLNRLIVEKVESRAKKMKAGAAGGCNLPDYSFI